MWYLEAFKKHSLQQVSQTAYLAQTLQSNVNNKKKLKIMDDDHRLLFFCPITALYWYMYQFMLDMFSSIYPSLWSPYLLNGVVHVLPDLFGLSQLLLFQWRRDGHISKLSRSPQFGH